MSRMRGEHPDVMGMLVRSGIITDPMRVASVTIRMAVGEPVTAVIEQFVAGQVELERIVKTLRVEES